MPKFRNITADTVNVGASDGPPIEGEHVYEAYGQIVEETDEAYIVKIGHAVDRYAEDDGGNLSPVYVDELRAWPKSTWQLVGSVLTEPAKSANKPEWVAYAVALGKDPAAVEGMTKEQLVAEFGTDTEGGQA